MKKRLVLTTLILIFLLSPISAGPATTGAAQAETRIQLEPGSIEFGMIAAGELWIKSGSELYLTRNSGSLWSDISPETKLVEPFLLVSFPGPKVGYALYLTQTDTEIDLEIYQTTTKGKAWKLVEGNLEGKISQVFDQPFGDIQMQWLNEKQAMVLVKQFTSANFSQGTLFITDDGGLNWQAVEVPAAEKFVFLNRDIGFMLNPTDSTTLYRTMDGGMNWSLIEAYLPGGSDGQLSELGLPVLLADGQVYLPVTTTEDDANETDLLVSADLTSTSEQPIDLNVSNAKNIQTVASGEQIFLDRKYDVTDIQTKDAQEIWVSLASGECQDVVTEDGEEQRACQTTWQLMNSKDGGLDWTTVSLPDGQNVASKATTFQVGFSQTSQNDISLDSGLQATWIEYYKGPAFDKCAIPTLSQLQTWYNSSPYKAVNLYIGGISRYCANTSLSASYIQSMYLQGWRFIPTWVGHQAPSPCANFNYPFPLDVNQAYQYGVNNANQASARLRELNLTNPDGTGSVIYLDLEHFTYSTSCSNAARAYVNGWTTRLAQLGIRSGLYSSSTNIRDNKYYNLSVTPVVVWIAEWYAATGYRPNETVWNLRYLSNDYWVNYQRILQYCGDHTETWGGVSLVMDSDVAEGVVAVPYGSNPVNNRIWLPMIRKR